MNGTLWNFLWSRTIVESLRALGVRHFYLSTGARSAPLVRALAECQGIEIRAHYDERGMAFAALGAAHATGMPAVCLTTSGSAVANLLPAVIEASYSEIPLLVLTADRPPELRGTGANQTITQSGIFGSSIRWQMDLPCPTENLFPMLSHWVADAFLHSLGKHPGPVHLNVPFREPLLPEGSHTHFSFAPIQRTPETIPPVAANPLPSIERGVILVGELTPSEQARSESILRLALHLGWPVFADALSGMKGSWGPVIQHAGLLLQRSDAPSPDTVLHLGGRIVSKRIGEFFRSLSGANYLQVRNQSAKLDPWGQHPHCIQADPMDFAHASMQSMPEVKNRTWLQAWQAADEMVSELLHVAVDEEPHLSEPGLSRLVARLAAQEKTALFLGNSMIVRDFDVFVGRQSQAIRSFGQRGASGIDGNIAHIAGIAQGSKQPLFALLGDQAFLHDLNSLPLLQGLPVVLFVVNNSGGGIFQFLPMEMPENVRETWLINPHAMTLEAACKQFSLPYLCSEQRHEIEQAILERQNAPLVIEVPTARKGNYHFHQELKASLRSLPSLWNLPPR